MAVGVARHGQHFHVGLTYPKPSYPMAFGFCRISAVMPSEDGNNRVSGENRAVLLLSPGGSLVQEKDVRAGIALARKQHNGAILPTHLPPVCDLPV